MLSVERQNEILDMLRRENSVSVEKLAQTLFVSAATIRRDLDTMAREGLVKRIFGGAVLLDSRGNDLPLQLREHENIEAKRAIAAAALTLVKSGNILMMDSSTTALALAQGLRAFAGMTVITNGVNTCAALSDLTEVKVLCTGGALRPGSLSLMGQHACDYVTRLNADIFFFSCRGVSTGSGVTDSSDEEAILKRHMCDASQRRVLLCDHTKFNKVFLSRDCRLEELDCVICDRAPEGELLEALRSARVKVMVGRPDGGCDEI